MLVSTSKTFALQPGQVGQPGAGDREDECDSGDGGIDRNGLGAELPPGEPDHRRASSGAAPTAAGGPFHVGEHEVLQSEPADRPRRIEDRAVGADHHGGLPIGVAGRDDLLVARQGVDVPARAGQPVVGGEQLLDVALDPHLGVDQHDEVVADPFQVGDHVRGQQDAELVLGDRLHQHLQELAAGERVEARDRLVEDQQLGPLGQAQGERELRALPAGQLAGTLGGSRPSRSTRDRAIASSQRGFRAAPSRRWSAMLSPA